MSEAFSIYYSARIRGMKSKLFTRAQYDEILESHDVQVAVDKLLNSPAYSEDMADSLTRAQGADAVEDAVTRNLVRTMQRLYKGIMDDDYRSLAQVFLTRWDLAAVKALLRYRHHNVPVAQHIQELVPGPTMPVAVMRELAQRESMPALIGGLVAWNSVLCSPLQKALPEYEATGNLAVLEEAMDKGYFAANAAALAKIDGEDEQLVRRVLQMEIDKINLRRLLTMRSDADLASKLLPGGAIGRGTLTKMVAAGSPEQVVEMLAGTPYRSLAEGVYELVVSGRYAQMERLFEREMIHQLRKASRLHVLSIAVFLEYAWMKYNEVMNLRLLVRGEARHLPRGRIREEMVYV